MNYLAADVLPRKNDGRSLPAARAPHTLGLVLCEVKPQGLRDVFLGNTAAAKFYGQNYYKRRARA